MDIYLQTWRFNFFGGLGFELITSCLLSKYLIIWTIPPTLFALIILLFLDCDPPYFRLPTIANMIDTCHHHSFYPLRSSHRNLFFFVGLSLNSGLHAFKAVTLLLETCLQSILLCLFYIWGLMNYFLGLASNHHPANLSPM
jgi:hypothetical protein